jgi:hypothetical protein
MNERRTFEKRVGWMKGEKILFSEERFVLAPAGALVISLEFQACISSWAFGS